MCTKEMFQVTCEKVGCKKYNPAMKYNCGCFERETQRWEAEHIKDGEYVE